MSSSSLNNTIDITAVSFTNEYPPLSGGRSYDPIRAKRVSDAHLDEQRIVDAYDFMTIPPREQNRQMVLKFVRRAIAHGQLGTCMVCSRECQVSTSKTLDIDAIPSQELLMPTGRLAHLDFGGGMVLDAPAVTWDPETAPFGSVCSFCYDSLCLEEQPTMSLASGFWVGHVPVELSGLTLAERLLIARRVPGVYVLYESKEDLVQNLDDTLGTHNDSYNTSPPGIQNTLPMTLSQLRSLIRMPAESKMECAPECMRVRRTRVEKALLYLKKFHPFYDDVEMSMENLSSLPESAIPVEIVEHMSTSKLLMSPMKVYPHRTDANYDHPSEIHQFSWMFPTLVPRLSGPLNSDNIDWTTVSEWFVSHSESHWRGDDFFLSWLFKKVCDQRIRREAAANESKCDLMVAQYSAEGASATTNERLEDVTQSILSAVPGSSVARRRAHDLFWSITAVKSPPTFHLIVEPRVLDAEHPLSYSIFADSIHDPTPKVKNLNNATRLILAELLGTRNLGHIVARSPGHEHHHGALGKVSAYLTSMDPDGSNGMRMHIAIWITNAPPFNILQLNMRKRNYRRDFGRYCDAVFANLDPRAPPTEGTTHSFVSPHAEQQRNEGSLWNTHLMRAAGVEVTLRAVTTAADVALLGDVMSRPIQSLVPIEGSTNILSFYKPINGVPDRKWGETLVDINVRSHLGEISTPEQVHYLLRGSDFTMSHRTFVIHLDAVRRMLYDNFVDLRNNYSGDDKTIRADVCAHTTNTLQDYAARGTALGEQNFLEFCLTTEETRRNHKWNLKRFRYILGSGQEDRSRVKLWREVLPQFKGRWIPRLDDDESGDLHRAMVLLLLKPWRYLPDLHPEHSRWDSDFSEFMCYADNKTIWNAQNFQFFHEARDAVVEAAVANVK